jgi:hypothetical protein
MPKGRRIKQVLRKGGRAAKNALAPIAKQAFQAGLNAAKQELRKGGRSLLHQVANRGPLLLGMGDYSSNSLHRGARGGMPNTGSSTITIRRREPLGKIISSEVAGAFKMDRYRVQPADILTFPWLQGIAGNYESWKPVQLFFEYVPTSGMSVASSNTALGTAIMAPQYNPLAVDPNNLQQIQGIQQSVSFAPYEHAACYLECKPKLRQAETLLIRNANVSADEGSGNARTLFDLCEFFVATEGLQEASVTVGQLFVNYTITLINPVVPLRSAFNDGLLVCSHGTVAGSGSTFQYPFTNCVVGEETGNITAVPDRSGSTLLCDDSSPFVIISSLSPGEYMATAWLQGESADFTGANLVLNVIDHNTNTAYPLTSERQYDSNYDSAGTTNKYFKTWFFEVNPTKAGPVRIEFGGGGSTMPDAACDRFCYTLKAVPDVDVSKYPTQFS